MVSKFISLPNCKPKNAEHHKTFEFAHWYDSAADKNITLKKDFIVINNDPSDVSTSKATVRGLLLDKKAKKKSKGVIVTKTVSTDDQNLVALPERTIASSGCKLTSTSKSSNKKVQNIKSIIKDKPSFENSLDLPHVPKVNRKKRNKSVSFMLEDNDAVVVKKTKSDESLIPKAEKGKHSGKINKAKNQQKEDKENDLSKDLVTSENKIEVFDRKIKSSKSLIRKTEKNYDKNTRKGVKKQVIEEKENNSITDITPSECGIEKQHCKTENIKKDKNIKKGKPINNDVDTCKNTASTMKKNIDMPVFEKPIKKKKNRSKVLQDLEKAGPTATNSSNNAKQNCTSNKNSKRPRKNKQFESAEIGEPEKKTLKIGKDDNIAEGIENLNIGDNPHTLTNLLDDMTVTKNKKKSNKKETKVVSMPDNKSEDKQKLNQSKRHKNRKTNAAVLVQNLPFRILFSYKLKLREFFSRYGTVQSIGIADLKCNQHEAHPIFTTRVFFKTEEEATAALDGDKELFEGNIIRVKKFILHPTRTFRSSSWVNRNKRNQTEATTTDNSMEDRVVDNIDID